MSYSMEGQYKQMQENEKMLREKFWTIDMVVLASINIVLLSVILLGVGLITGVYAGPFRAWLAVWFEI